MRPIHDSGPPPRIASRSALPNRSRIPAMRSPERRCEEERRVYPIDVNGIRFDGASPAPSDAHATSGARSLCRRDLARKPRRTPVRHAGGWLARTPRNASGLVGDDDFDAAVELTAGGVAVVRDRVRLAEAV